MKLYVPVHHTALLVAPLAGGPLQGVHSGGGGNQIGFYQIVFDQTGLYQIVLYKIELGVENAFALAISKYLV